MTISTNVPLALLPVRIETRFAETAAGVELQIRMFPDQVHIDAHEPALTAAERDATELWHAGARDLAAWRELNRRVGPRRASYIASLAPTADPGVRDDVWTRAPLARLLPHRWSITVDLPGSAPLRANVPGPARDLSCGFSPDDAATITPETIELAPETKWIAEFAAALDAGMAARIALPSGTTGPLDVIVVGMRDGDASADAEGLAALVDAHRFSDGLGVLAPGTPTNFTHDELPPWSSQRATPDVTFPIEVTGGHAASGSAGASIAAALGIAAAHFDAVDPGTLPDAQRAAEEARAMNAAAWPATIGYFLEQMLDGASPPAPTIERARTLFIEHVRGSGPLPVLRVGRTPYGVLPIWTFSRWRPATAEDGQLAHALQGLRRSWDAAGAKVAKLWPSATDDAIAQVLAMAPISTSYVGRSVIGAAYATYLFDFVQAPLTTTWWNAQRTRALAAWNAAHFPAAEPRLAHATYADVHFTLRGPIAQTALDDAPLAPNYIAQIAAASLEDLRARAELPPATPLLYRLLRHAGLSAYLAAARRAQTTAATEPEMIGLSTGAQAPWTWITPALRSALDATRAGGGGDRAFADVWTALSTLSSASSRRLDTLCREVLDLCSHRLDAWHTALANERLAAMRHATPSGVHVGAYGLVIGLERARSAVVSTPVPNEPGPLVAAAAQGGFVHAPSLQHATTAALLRSGFVAHRHDNATPFAVDLRSARVRLAREILDAVRTGESVGAVLGRMAERAIMDATTPALWPFLFALRTAVAQGVAMPDRVPLDGNAFVTRVGAGLAWGTAGLPAAGSAEAGAIAALAARLADAVDSVGDVLVAESIHQLAAGAPDRTAATLDSIALGAPPPAEIGVLDVRGRGVGLMHTVSALVPAAVTASGWTRTPRAVAEPSLEAWCAAMLGSASTYAAGVRSAAGVRIVRFDALGLGALDLVRLAASGELRDWILDRERGDRPVTLEPDRPSGARGIDDALALGAALAEVLARGRAAGPSDFGLAGAPDPVAIAALEARGSDSELDDALALLSTDPIAGLRAACLLGVRGAVPAGDPSTEQAQRVASVLVARRDQLHALGVATTDAERTARATARLQLLYGRDLVVLPAFAIPDVGLAASLGDRAALLADPEDAVVWLSNVGAARTGAAALERAVLVADVLGGPDPASQLLVAQLPHVPGDPWIGRAVFQPEPDPELPAPPPQGRRSYVIHAPLGLDLAQPVAGLIVDAFNETVPQAKQTTGIAFQLEQPTACPPQTVLLAVPSDAAPAWTDDAVEAVVREALALAQLRMVDGDLIDAAGQYLPALYFAINLAGDTASTDFTGGT